MLHPCDLQLISSVRASPGPEYPIYSASINPVNPTKCAVSGNGVFRYVSIEEDRCVVVCVAFEDLGRWGGGCPARSGCA